MNYCDINSLTYDFIVCKRIIEWQTLAVGLLGLIVVYYIYREFFKKKVKK